MTTEITAGDLMSLLRRRFAAPAWAFLPQVRDSTGAGASRTADAVAMGLWPSRGIHLHGFEVKAYRSDWRRELRNPQKAEMIAQFCDFWWIVAPKGVVPIEELPDNWGLLEAKGKSRLVAVRKAEKLDSTEPDRLFLAAILRRAQEVVVPREEIAAEIQLAREEERKRAKESAGWERERQDREHQSLKEAVEKFEKAAGIKVDRWGFRGEEEAKAFREALGLVRAQGEVRGKLEAAERNLAIAIELVREALGETVLDAGMARRNESTAGGGVSS